MQCVDSIDRIDQCLDRIDQYLDRICRWASMRCVDSIHRIQRALIIPAPRLLRPPPSHRTQKPSTLEAKPRT